MNNYKNVFTNLIRVGEFVGRFPVLFSLATIAFASTTNPSFGLSLSDLALFKIFKKSSNRSSPSAVSLPASPIASHTMPIVSTGPTIDLGDSGICAISDKGKVVCVGKDLLRTPDYLGAATQVSVGSSHACAVVIHGDVVCWGDNFYGQINVPIDLLAFGSVRQISAGDYHTCAVNGRGDAVCWGSNNNQQSRTPRKLGQVKQVSAGRGHTCAIRLDDTVECWGEDTSAYSNNYKPFPKDLGVARQIESGANHTCIVNQDGKIDCWGENEDGQCNPPAHLGAVRQVSAHYNHTCAITYSGDTICWGGDLESKGLSLIPKDLGFAIQVATNYSTTCIVNDQGELRCCGFTYEDDHNSDSCAATYRLARAIETPLFYSQGSNSSGRLSLFNTSDSLGPYAPRPVAQLVYDTKRPIWDGLRDLVEKAPNPSSRIIGEYLLIRYLETMQMGRIDQAIEKTFYPELNAKIKKTGNQLLGITDISQIERIGALGSEIYPPLLAHLVKFVPSALGEVCQPVDAAKKALNQALAQSAVNSNDRSAYRNSTESLEELLNQIEQYPDCHATLSNPGELAGIWQLMDHINRLW